MRKSESHKAVFISIEDKEPDLILGFALALSATRTLTLIRTPKFESMLDEGERGVAVSLGASTRLERNLLIEVRRQENLVLVLSEEREYRLDLSDVDADEIKDAKELLERMNFDHSFRMHAA